MSNGSENAGESGNMPELPTNLRRLSYFAQTAEYHQTIHSTLSPDDPLVLNPGKTRAQLMTDEEIERYLDAQQKRIKHFAAILAEDPSSEGSIGNFLRDMRTDRELSLIYLAEIGRLPDGFVSENDV